MLLASLAKLNETFSVIFKHCVSVGKECTVVGWGLDKIDHGTYALRQAKVTILDNSVCKKRHLHTSEAKWENIVCIGNPGDLKQKIMLGLVSQPNHIV